MPTRVLLRDSPHRAIALATDSHVLIFRHSPSATSSGLRSGSVNSLSESGAPPRCIVEFSPWESADMEGYRPLSSLAVHGTLGLVSLNNDVFLCVVNGTAKVASVRPGESIQRILSVEFHCLSRPDYDHLLIDQVNPFPDDSLGEDGFNHGHKGDPLLEHPCMALKKLLSGGSFYYSADFDLTKRLQDRPTEASTLAIDSLDAGFLWNTYMIQPLVDLRSRLSDREREALDASRILTSVIRGFAHTVTVPASSSPARSSASGLPSSMTLISRLSCRRAGTRFNARGVDDDGNVANFVETETIFCTNDICFSYVQVRGSVPVFWEQATSFAPGQQKISITRSAEATQPAFDKHFENLVQAYGDVHVVNLLSADKPGEVELTGRYNYHVEHCSVNRQAEKESSEHNHLKAMQYDFHAETRSGGYEAASGIKRWIRDSALSFDYYLSEDTIESPRVKQGTEKRILHGQNEVLKQAGVFRTNCLDCLDRTNLVQTIISQMAIEIFLSHRRERSPTSDFWARHGMLWADCGDALSKIYAGTGALKSSFTRHGKMSLAGAIADVRKSAQRLYINNFEDKGRQNTIDMLLGRLMGQMPVDLYDPINDFVTSELNKRSAEYTSSQTINIWVGTFNLNGRTEGISEDLSPWLCPDVERSLQAPEIVAVGFQEIVELSPQQIMSTDPNRRQAWESAVQKTLNAKAQRIGSDDYVLLRGGQLVGASQSVFVKASVLPYIKNVEGAVKKTGMSGMAGNKGAVAIRMEYADTSICLVTAHLAAGFANYEERNQDYQTISSGLRFQRNRSIQDHDTIIWFGDFNYRIGISNERARQLIDIGDLGTLYENDQLNLQMVHGRTFPYYSETTPTFMPTYKYNPGTDVYDTSEKARIPAWCDRIITKGDNLRQIHYDTAPLRFSDHRPVWGTFHCTVSVVDSNRKDQISSGLYLKRRAIVGDHTANTRTEDSEDDELNGYEAIEPGLPPASSDKRKWWLDGGAPARSTVKPPGNGFVLNQTRPSNPFAPSPEPDWVNVNKPSAPPSRRASWQTDKSTPSQDYKAQQPRKVPPPYKSGNTATDPPQKNLDGTTDMPPPALRQTLRKPAPPKPTKPTLLRSGSSQSATSPKPAPPPPEPRRVNNASSTAANNMPFPPPPRRSTAASRVAQEALPPQPPRNTLATPQGPRAMTLRKTVPPPGAAGADDGPPLPPRRQTGALMNEAGEQELKGWQPLKPQ